MQLVKVEETINYFITPSLAIKESTMRNWDHGESQKKILGRNVGKSKLKNCEDKKERVSFIYWTNKHLCNV